MKPNKSNTLIIARIFIVLLTVLPNVLNEKREKNMLCSLLNSSDECVGTTECIWCANGDLKNRCICYEEINNTTNNNEVQNESDNFIIQKAYSIWDYLFRIGAYIIIFVFGVIGNVAVIYVIFKFHRMRTTTNILISNLACADLLVIVFCLPFQLYNNLYLEWKFGDIFCKLVPYLQGVSVCASIFILMAISVERCLTICHPIHYTRNTISKYVIFCIWMFPVILPMPWLLYFEVQRLENYNDIHVCVESWPNVDIGNIYFVAVNILLCYLLPLSVISICFYCIWKRVSTRILPGENIVQCNAMIHRSKLKVTKMMLIVIVIFTCSWLPLYIIFTFVKFGKSTDLMETLIPYAQWLGVSNSCINPILYAFYNRNFRNTFKALFSRKTCCKSLLNYQSTISSRTPTYILSYQAISRKNPKPSIDVAVFSIETKQQVKKTKPSRMKVNDFVSLKNDSIARNLNYI